MQAPLLKALEQLSEAFNGGRVQSVMDSHWHEKEEIPTIVSLFQIMYLSLFKLINCTPVKLQINESDQDIVFPTHW